MEVLGQSENRVYPTKYMTINNIALILQMILTISGLFCLIRVYKLYGFRDSVMLLSMVCVTLSLILQMISNILSMAYYSIYFRSSDSE